MIYNIREDEYNNLAIIKGRIGLSGRRIHLLLPHMSPPLPLAVESIGRNPQQEPIVRPGGYPFFHWLHTIAGEGEFDALGQTYRLAPNSGVLLAPGVQHAYRAASPVWTTGYVTFYGSQAQAMLEAMGIGQVSHIRWEAETEVGRFFAAMLHNVTRGLDPTGVEPSSDLYRFLLLLKKYGAINHRSSISHHMDKIRPLLDWLETQCANPDIGLAEMAAVLGVRPRTLNLLFSSALGVSAYAFLIGLRIRKAKDLLVREPELPIKLVAERTGYRDASHFTAVFRKETGTTPQRYRQMLT